MAGLDKLAIRFVGEWEVGLNRWAHVKLSALERSTAASEFEVNGSSILVTFDSDGTPLKVFWNRCAHLGSPLKITNKGFHCPSHLWAYDFEGQGTTSASSELSEAEWELTNEGIRVKIHADEPLFQSDLTDLDGSETLWLLSHASFLLETKNTSIIFDPWFTGEAYWGAWSLWPVFEHACELGKAAKQIVVTHPHPDHFHPESLDHFSRDTPVHFPPFQSRIIPKKLQEMGFRHLIECEWETEVEISEDVRIAFLRPNSVWEDSSVAVRVGNWHWMNQNDAGASFRTNIGVPSFDLLTSAFDVGASGYPLTWDLSERRQDAILRNAKIQILEGIRLRSNQLKAKYFAPFAGWWRHGLAEHQAFRDRLDHASLDQVVEALSGSETRVLPSIPGFRLNLKSMTEELHPFPKADLDSPYPSVDPPSSPESHSSDSLSEGIANHLRELANMSVATNTEHIEFRVRIEGTEIEVTQIFGQGDGSPIQVNVEISRRTAILLMSGDPTVTWDSIAIGYWGRWSRFPDLYPVNFMRLLQLGYVADLATNQSTAVSAGFAESFPISKIVEEFPDAVRQILGRYGLFCISCSHSQSETIEDAAMIHNLSASQTKALIAEIRGLLANRSKSNWG